MYSAEGQRGEGGATGGNDADGVVVRGGGRGDCWVEVGPDPFQYRGSLCLFPEPLVAPRVCTAAGEGVGAQEAGAAAMQRRTVPPGVAGSDPSHPGRLRGGGEAPWSLRPNEWYHRLPPPKRVHLGFLRSARLLPPLLPPSLATAVVSRKISACGQPAQYTDATLPPRFPAARSRASAQGGGQLGKPRPRREILSSTRRAPATSGSHTSQVHVFHFSRQNRLLLLVSLL